MGSYQTDTGRNVTGFLNNDDLMRDIGWGDGAEASGALFFKYGTKYVSHWNLAAPIPSDLGIGLDASRVWGVEHTGSHFAGPSISFAVYIAY